MYIYIYVCVCVHVLAKSIFLNVKAPYLFVNLYSYKSHAVIVKSMQIEITYVQFCVLFLKLSKAIHISDLILYNISRHI